MSQQAVTADLKVENIAAYKERKCVNGIKGAKEVAYKKSVLTKRLIKIKQAKLKNQISLKQKEALIST